ncbi:hypothetical protein J8J04_02730 ['Fragaria x ananassa' phyllody phytoplasma]|uniref:Uncharacterized protein n=1 Tax='Fragaria x ananassa' phyllody phytoplasma TaxID=2358428 RepID=A0ABS5K3W8_9MOLU|nr:hypothetical protein ['Fragaria x ananassa' phyllody phytoplasma]MBS2126588.1 hypothetical protein ['Fragaria x ananassa' phyllody phytoplasma]
MKIMKKNHSKKINKIAKVCITISVLVIIVISSLLIYEFIIKEKTNKEQISVIPKQETDRKLYHDFVLQIYPLKQQIKITEEELKDSQLTQEEKTVIEKVITLKKSKLEELENELFLIEFSDQLKKEINNKETQLQITTDLAEKHLATEEKLTKEKTLIEVEKLLKSNEEKKLSQKKIQDITTKLINETNPETKTSLNNEKTKQQENIQEIKNAISLKMKQLKLNQDIKNLDAEIKTINNEEEQKILIEYRKNKQKKFDSLK